MRMISKAIMTALLALLAFAGCVNDDPSPMGSKVEVGDELPRFSIVLSDGRTFDTTRRIGKETLLMFFNSGCSDCREAMPKVQRYADAHPETEVICISRSEGEEDVAAYWKSNGYTMLYSAQSDAEVYHLFAQEGIPRYYLADADNRILSVRLL